MCKLFIISLVTFFSLPACSTFYGVPSGSTGSQSLSETVTTLSFTGETGSISYRTITFTNRSSVTQSIVDLGFTGNDCGAFAVSSLLDSNGNQVTGYATDVAPGESAQIVLQFAPPECTLATYDAVLLIQYLEDGVQKYSTVDLATTISDPIASDDTTCPENNVTYWDNIGDPTPSRTLPTLPDGQNYYLKIEKVRAYLQTTGEFASFSVIVGTHIFLDGIPDEKEFKGVYIPIESDGQGNIVFKKYDKCVGFYIPTTTYDPYYLGATHLLTTAQDYPGTVSQSGENIGELTVPDIHNYIQAEINNTASAIQNDDGLFGIMIHVTLTTGKTATNPYLQYLTDVQDDQGTYLFPDDIIEDGDASYLQGKNLHHGVLSLASVGSFGSEDALMSSVAYTGLVENPSYFFVIFDSKIVIGTTDGTTP